MSRMQNKLDRLENDHIGRELEHVLPHKQWRLFYHVLTTRMGLELPPDPDALSRDEKRALAASLQTIRSTPAQDRAFRAALLEELAENGREWQTLH